MKRNSGSRLNPFAKEWDPWINQAPMEERSLFMTFSRGFPLSEYEIVDYFRRIYGNCVEDVFICTPRNNGPEFGKIVFTKSSIPAVILNNENLIKLYVEGKSLWLKRYNIHKGSL